MCYYLLGSYNQIKSENDCCFEFNEDSSKKIICSTNSQISCAGEFKTIMNGIFNNCKKQKQLLNNKEELFFEEPLTCASEGDYQIENIKRKQIGILHNRFITNKSTFVMNTRIHISRIEIERRKIILRNIFKGIKNLLDEAMNEEASTVNETSEGIKIINSDGSITSSDSLGDSVIEKVDGTIIILKKNKEVKIKEENCLTYISKSGDVVKSFVNENKVITLKKSGEMIESRLFKGKIEKFFVNKEGFSEFVLIDDQKEINEFKSFITSVLEEIVKKTFSSQSLVSFEKISKIDVFSFNNITQNQTNSFNNKIESWGIGLKNYFKFYYNFFSK